MSNVIFEITDENFVISTFEDENGLLKSKTISIDSFLNVINDSVVSSDKMINMSKFIYFSGNELKFNCARLIKSCNWGITHKKKAMIVELPDLVFIVDNSGEMKIMVYKNEKLYKFDYPNMLQNNDVCFGSFVKKEITVDEVDSYILEYMATPYSHGWTFSSKDGIYKIDEKDLIGNINEVLGGYIQWKQ